jgi:hypothetical protein
LLNTVLGSFSSGVAASTSSYESIASATGTGSSGTITFSSIPSTYTHLQLRCLVSDTFTAANGAQEGWLQFNSDTASNYSYHRLSGNGSTASAAGIASNTVMDDEISVAYGSTGAFGVAIIDIQNYASTTQYKTVRSFSGSDLNGSGYVRLASGNWRSTSAITSITIGGAIFAFSTATKIALYGIKGA